MEPMVIPQVPAVVAGVSVMRTEVRPECQEAPEQVKLEGGEWGALGHLAPLFLGVVAVREKMVRK